MPMASRNMCDSLKHDRFTGKEDLDEVRIIFKKLVECVDHMHSKGVLHGDLKPLNIVRMNMGQQYDWRLIDLDASCDLPREVDGVVNYVGKKSSTAYMPPNMFFEHKTEDQNGNEECKYYGRTEANLKKYFEEVTINDDEENEQIRYCLKSANEESEYYEAQAHDEPLKTKEYWTKDEILVKAEPSHDIWSLGCILYQLCHPYVMPLFNASRDDNLSSSHSDEDNMKTLYEWSDDTKAKKLDQITDASARNLLSFMLVKKPEERCTLQRIKVHQFYTNMKEGEANLPGSKEWRDKEEHQYFVSYRVDADLKHARLLTDELNKRNFKVFLDKDNLIVGDTWKEQFLEGMMRSRNVICLISRGAINNKGVD